MPSAPGTATDDRAQRSPPPDRTWPRTAALVLLGWALLAWDLLMAGIDTAPLFGDVPDRDRYAESGATLLTALVPVLLLCGIGLVVRCRSGLLVLLLPGLLVAVAGVDLARTPGDPADPTPNRPFAASDLVSELTHANWVASGVLAVLLLLLLARRARQGRRPAYPRQSARRPDPQS